MLNRSYSSCVNLFVCLKIYTAEVLLARKRVYLLAAVGFVSGCLMTGCDTPEKAGHSFTPSFSISSNRIREIKSYASSVREQIYDTVPLEMDREKTGLKGVPKGAVRRFYEFGTDANPVLVELLTDPHASVKLLALKSITVINWRAATRINIGMLTSDDGNVRAEAAHHIRVMFPAAPRLRTDRFPRNVPINEFGDFQITILRWVKINHPNMIEGIISYNDSGCASKRTVREILLTN